ncbi:hypothetical protein AB4525_15065 [Vibrio breoganii]
MVEGTSNGTVYAHAWFAASAKRALEAENFGDTCAGMTVVTLTAFMVESYFNYICSRLLNKSELIEAVLDSDLPLDVVAKLDDCEKKLGFEERVAKAYGIDERYELLANNLIKFSHGQKSKQLAKCFEESGKDGADFTEIDNKFRIPPIVKCKAILDTVSRDERKNNEFVNIVVRLFSARNSLAHGKTESVSNTFTIDDEEVSPESCPSVIASWQESCSLEKAQSYYGTCTELVNYIGKLALDEEHPLLTLSSQVSGLQGHTKHLREA